MRKLAIFGQVMISNDEIQSDAARSFGCSEGPNSSIDADHQPHAIGGRPLNDIVLHSIAIANAMRHMEVCASSRDLNGFLENYDRSRAINVIIAIDQNAFAVSNRLLNARDRLAHSLHQIREVQVIELRAEKFLDRIGVAHSARNKEARNQRRNTGFARNSRSEFFVNRLDNPAQTKSS